MKKLALVLCALCAAILPALVPSPAPAADAPTAQQILDRVAKALGGRDALARATMMHLQYTGTMFGMKGTLEQWVAADGRTESHVSVGGLFNVRSVFDRDHGWTLDQNGKVSELAGDDLEHEVTAAYDATWSYLLEGRMPGAVHYDGVEDSTGAYVIRCEPKGGVPITYYVDPKSYLPERSRTPAGDRTQTVTMTQWKSFDGVMMPTHVVQSFGDPKYDTTFDLASAELNATPPEGTFGKPVEKGSDVTFTKGSPVRDIPLEFNTVHIFLQASVNGSKPLWFVLDSGAGATVLNRDVAQKLGLKLKGKVEARGAGKGSMQVNLIPDVSISLPGVALKSQTVAALPTSDIEARIGREIDGVLGYDFISRFVVEIDYHAHTLTLYDPKKFDYQGDGTVVPIVLSNNTPQVEASFTTPGGVKLSGDFLVDTGAGASVIFTSPYAKKRDLVSDFTKKFEFSGGFGVGGESKSTIARLASLTIGGLTFKEPTCAISHDTGGALANPKIAGLIGGLALSRCRVYFDYDRKHMILERGADFDAPFEIDWSGLIMNTGGRGHFHEITVIRALPGSPAETAGIQKGDVITRVDDLHGDALTINALWKAFRRAGKTVHVTVTRDGKSKEVSLALNRRV